MYAGQVFECREMKSWEKKEEVNKTIDNAKGHFKEIFEDNKTYARKFSGIAKKLGLESAARIKDTMKRTGTKSATFLGTCPRR